MQAQHHKYGCNNNLQHMTWYTPRHGGLDLLTLYSPLRWIYLFLPQMRLFAYFTFQSSHITEEIPSPDSLLSAWRSLFETVTDDYSVMALFPHLSPDIPIGCCVWEDCWDLLLDYHCRVSTTVVSKNGKGAEKYTLKYLAVFSSDGEQLPKT